MRRPRRYPLPRIQLFFYDDQGLLDLSLRNAQPILGCKLAKVRENVEDPIMYHVFLHPDWLMNY
ncbi:MAG: hypothetical protein AAF718_06970 [Pseudomonadota bacterium]